ncbi:hypothetical protein [Longimicrobium sp.]|uniref:hypothetical protein n=1 Tax=Longimicrobium sp. TaxID=2029185 RepID=UPI002E35A519|nr:hypothetical protein [Longimicrobium sp.]HEX6040705.1 hypothetical protein [Longimicrobium sp.]
MSEPPTQVETLTASEIEADDRERLDKMLNVVEIDVSPDAFQDPQRQAKLEVELEQFAKKVGPLLGIAGSSRHGKTVLAIMWNAYRKNRSVRLDYLHQRTARDRVFLRPVWGDSSQGNRTRAEALPHFGIMDLSGENLDALVHEEFADYSDLDAEYSPETQLYIEKVLWRMAQKIQGLILTICFPLLWYPSNKEVLDEEHIPLGLRNAAPDVPMRINQEMMQRVLHVVYLARARLRGAPTQPPRNEDELLHVESDWPRIDIPVFVALTKADLFPRLVSPLDAPDRNWASPAKLLRSHMPELYADLHRLTRDFTVQYVHTLDAIEIKGSGPGVRYDAVEMEVKRSDAKLVGGEALDEFFGRFPWERSWLPARWFLPRPSDSAWGDKRKPETTNREPGRR